MCRYGFHSYKDHLACFRCRKSFKRRHVSEWPDQFRPADGSPAPAPCPECGSQMADMGLDFKPPRADGVEHWEVVAFLFDRGFTYHSCGCGGPGFRPSRWAEVPAFLASQRRPSDGECLADRFAARRKPGEHA